MLAEPSLTKAMSWKVERRRSPITYSRQLEHMPDIWIGVTGVDILDGEGVVFAEKFEI
jgi:hypothetical protein